MAAQWPLDGQPPTTFADCEFQDGNNSKKSNI